MRSRWRRSARGMAVVGGLTGLLLGACSGAPSTLDPRGPAAATIATLWWVMAGLGTVIFVVVVALLLVGLARGARRTDDAPTPPGGANDGRAWVLTGGIIVPTVVLVALSGLTIWGLAALAAPARPATVTIEVIGHDWWWEIRYPDQRFTTANEIHIPVGQPVSLRLTSRDVIHSFWVPQLHGKIDLIPGTTTTLWLQADQPGEYRGLCAEFCGIQHAKMQFLVIAEPPDQFQAWLDRQRRPAAAPSDTLAGRGQQVFLGSSCITCHTVRGTQATGALGPDLTHLASRRTLGAGILPNNRGNLAGWIVDSQGIKPGNLMPPSDLTGEELQALLAYLESLR